MSFNPLLPADGSPLIASEMRAQLNALNDEIAAIPAGPPGPQGQKGDKGDTGDTGPQGPAGPGSSGANCQIQFANGNGQFASDPDLYFIQGTGWTSLRCNWPTTDPQIAGVLWNNSGVLSISAG